MSYPARATIPCSVSLLTLNAADSLAVCLEGLKNFAEIIVCDGNSTDGTQEIAARYGAKVIRQYDTEEPNVPCATDKAAVRERAMAASTLQWRFFMDADDTLSEEAVDEISAIVRDPAPRHFIWRMPTRIFIDGREILHEATYPSYQTRLVHESVGACFKGPVHDHLVWDTALFPAGTMKNYYNFQWSKERVAHYWQYLSTYVKRELKTADIHRASLRHFFYWGVYRRLRIILGYVLWRLPRMYFRHGFRDSMPLPIELQIVAHHIWILFGSATLFLTSRPWFVVVRELFSGTGLSRARAYLALRDFEAYGRVLDVAGSADARHWDYLQTRRWHRDTFAADTFSFPDRHFDTVLLLNNEASDELIEGAVRVTRQGGHIIGIRDGHAFLKAVR